MTKTMANVGSEFRPSKLLRKSSENDERQRHFVSSFSGKWTEFSSRGSGHDGTVDLGSQPIITPREEELEWASVTPDEMREIEFDLKGLELGRSSGSETKTGGGLPRCVSRPTNSEREELLLPAMEAEIASLPDMDKEAYVEACRRCPAQVNNGHKKAFLFVENFDPKLAAQRLARHWQYKRSLFGPEKCFLSMTLSGAMADDIKVLSEGAFALLPVKDVGGRSILYSRVDILFRVYGANNSATTRKGLMRSLWYLLHIAGEDSETRRRGLVFMGNGRGVSFSQIQKSTPSLQRQCFEIMRKNGPPTVHRSFHICQPHPLFHKVSPILKYILDPKARKRLIVHYGASLDRVQTSMKKFGFDGSRLPLELGGEVMLDMSKWVSSRFIQECKSSQTASSAGSSGLSIHSYCAYSNEHNAQIVPFLAFSRQSYAASFINDLKSRECSTIVSESPSDNECSPQISLSKNRDRCRAQQSRFLVLNERILDEIAIIDRSSQVPLKKRSCAQCIPSPSTSASHTHKVQERDTEPTSAGTVRPPDRVLSSAPRRRSKSKRCRDPRMERAVDTRVADPQMSLFGALVSGGFDFPSRPTGLTDRTFHDREGVSLHQRKNQLCRRLRDYQLNDPRIDLAASATMRNPDMSMMDALQVGGFQFPKIGPAGKKSIRDLDNVTLTSRLKQLSNKLASMKAAVNVTDEQLAADSCENGPRVPLADHDLLEHNQHLSTLHGEETQPSIDDMNEGILTDWDCDSLEGHLPGTADLLDLDVDEAMKELSELETCIS
eukprot:CAMPEP_0113526336 /NCGR_PEP_ID=MMETSP0015_2-20120614/681_1 /TAXON_ID=2838 /ORGANISM="Odontella" /LENGTH=777 /DNA_ID=CAMNT_0000424643 /DNA_START=28 /DNA_END=2361 /DNA_ORIENTATION=+ /assembly_acc=CAM_ASM_000160